MASRSVRLGEFTAQKVRDANHAHRWQRIDSCDSPKIHLLLAAHRPQDQAVRRSDKRPTQHRRSTARVDLTHRHTNHAVLVKGLEIMWRRPFGPFVGFFGQESTDEADEGSAAGEDADDVGAAAHFFVESLLGIVGPDLAPQLARVGGEGQQLVAGVFEVLGCVRLLVGQGDHDAVELGVYRIGVGLVEDGADLGCDVGWGGFGDLGQQGAQVVAAAALQAAPGNTEAIAATSPGWASAVTSCTPDRPRATRPRHNAASRPRLRPRRHPGPGSRGARRR
jgi:hypothetical protein